MNKKNEIKIHLGYPKTATTTLQKHFFPNIKDIQYIGKHDNEGGLFDFDEKVVNDLIFKNPNKIDYENLREEFSKILNQNNVVLSEESFTSNSLRVSNIDGKDILPTQETIAKNIRTFFNTENFNVKILFTIRKQDEMITSQYAQSYVHYYSRYKESDSFAKFLNIYLDEKNKKHTFYETLDYFHVVGIYQKLFGKENVSVLVYEELQKTPQMFYSKLCDFLEIESSQYSEIAIQKNENKRSTNKNYKKTRDITFFDKLAKFKITYLPFVKIKLPSGLKQKLKEIVWTDNQKVSKTIFLTEEQKLEVLSRYKESNKKLSEMMQLNLKGYGYYND